MPPWCTCLFCIGWLGNVQRFITRAEPLYDSLNPCVLRRFCCRCGFCKISAVEVYKKSRCRLIMFCLLLYLWFKPKSHWKIPSEQLSFSTLENDCGTIYPWKFPEIRSGIFGRMVSAHGLGLARLVPARRPNSNRSAILFSQIYPRGRFLKGGITLFQG